MDKLRHIHSKVGSETAFRIPVSVEDAIAEAVEAYDALAKERDHLREALIWMGPAFKRALCALPVRCADEIIGLAEKALIKQAAALEGEGDE
jgi:hypothetical protein